MLLLLLINTWLASAFTFSTDSSLSRTVARGGSTIELNHAASPLTFDYTTVAPNPKNWIGIYPASGGSPVNGHRVDGSKIWEWVKEGRGSRHINAERLAPGKYKAVFLADGGYTQLADPIDFDWHVVTAQLFFPVDTVTLKNAREGEWYNARIGGLVFGFGNPIFRKASSGGSADTWIKVNEDGTIRGTPQPGDGGKTAWVDIEASGEGGSKAMLRVVIKIVGAKQRLVKNLRVMTWNVWESGKHAKRAIEKQTRFILATNVDVIGMQEIDAATLRSLGNKLGWEMHQGPSESAGILSRYPIVQRYDEIKSKGRKSPGVGVRINLDSNKQDEMHVDFWSVHLCYCDKYGPSDICKGKSQAEVLAVEDDTGRKQQMQDTVSRLKPFINDEAKTNISTILVGDMNSPSDLDWTESTQDKHCGVGNRFPWPVSVIAREAGLIDSYRVQYPVPERDPGYTWSPIATQDPQDRIDFIYGTKHLTVRDSEVMVVPGDAEDPDAEWTSDHWAVMTNYEFPSHD